MTRASTLARILATLADLYRDRTLDEIERAAIVLKRPEAMPDRERELPLDGDADCE